jgi:hypothetical protein
MQRLKLKYDELLSGFAFNVNVFRRYTAAAALVPSRRRRRRTRRTSRSASRADTASATR